MRRLDGTPVFWLGTGRHADGNGKGARKTCCPAPVIDCSVGQPAEADLTVLCGWPRTGHARGACTSRGNAGLTDAGEQLVRVTHPFHPLFSQRRPCVGRRSNRHGERLLLEAEDGTVWPVPPQWTDLASQDPDVVIGGGDALLRFADLVELADLVDRLSGKSVDSDVGMCKEDYAANVRRITPHG